jgi:hypothetical protein
LIEALAADKLRSHVAERGNVMSDGLEGLARRLVVGRKNDGRSVYDEAAKGLRAGSANLNTAFSATPQGWQSGSMR